MKNHFFVSKLQKEQKQTKNETNCKTITDPDVQTFAAAHLGTREIWSVVGSFLAYSGF